MLENKYMKCSSSHPSTTTESFSTFQQQHFCFKMHTFCQLLALLWHLRVPKTEKFGNAADPILVWKLPGCILVWKRRLSQTIMLTEPHPLGLSLISHMPNLKKTSALTTRRNSMWIKELKNLYAIYYAAPTDIQIHCVQSSCVYYFELDVQCHIFIYLFIFNQPWKMHWYLISTGNSL